MAVAHEPPAILRSAPLRARAAGPQHPPSMARSGGRVPRPSPAAPVAMIPISPFLSLKESGVRMRRSIHGKVRDCPALPRRWAAADRAVEENEEARFAAAVRVIHRNIQPLARQPWRCPYLH